MKIINKKARFSYKLFEKIEAGISLTGQEVKALRRNSADLGNSYAKIINNEVFLINANISVSNNNGNPTRTRKLLLHKKQIDSLSSKIKAKRLTLVPTKLYNKGRLIKIELALAKSKKKFEKKAILKKRDIEREIERSVISN